ncbi:MAG TPA: hypothetical protein DDY04_01980 [Bacteroidales bacterium]|nr:hypothetical protein [Bacteroidales bacterium]
MIILYSLLFKGSNHPIPAALTELTGLVPPSKGLSAAFSQIVRFNFPEAYRLNPHSLRIFSFFFIQLLVRGSILLVLTRYKPSTRVLIAIDITFSLLLFIYCFYPFMEYTFNILLQLLQ